MARGRDNRQSGGEGGDGQEWLEHRLSSVF
jgi:hypothetical protein